MSASKIKLFGCPSFSHDGATWTRQKTRSAELLLGYLAINGERPHHREKLAALIWSDVPPDRARGSLKTALWRLRQVLEPAGVTRGTYLRSNRAGEIGLNWDSGLWCDVRCFQTLLDAAGEARAESDVVETALTRAVRLYSGDLLEGFYDDWIIGERVGLHARFKDVLARLMERATAVGDRSAALDYGRRILSDDPLRESVHRAMIRLYLHSGHRILALRQYQDCAKALTSELGIEPMPETRALYPQIMAGALAERAVADRPEIELARRGVEDAVRRLHEARADLAAKMRAVPDGT